MACWVGFDFPVHWDCIIRKQLELYSCNILTLGLCRGLPQDEYNDASCAHSVDLVD